MFDLDLDADAFISGAFGLTTSSYWVVRSCLSLSADGEPALRMTDLDFILSITREKDV